MQVTENVTEREARHRLPVCLAACPVSRQVCRDSLNGVQVSRVKVLCRAI
jgi:hypothetical protein